MPKKPASISSPSVNEIEGARNAFLEREPRALFYRVAIELIDLSRRGSTKISVPEALAVLLQTWNASFYRFRGRFTEDDFVKIEYLLNKHSQSIDNFHDRSIQSLISKEEEVKIETLFKEFQKVLGPVGAAKALHLLAPLFFPLWDRAIAKEYRFKLDRNAPGEYVDFMNSVKTQCDELKKQGAIWSDLLKAIDEYNYCRFTLKLPLRMCQSG